MADEKQTPEALKARAKRIIETEVLLPFGVSTRLLALVDEAYNCGWRDGGNAVKVSHGLERKGAEAERTTIPDRPSLRELREQTAEKDIHR